MNPRYKMTKDAIEQNREQLDKLKNESPFLKAEDGVKFRILPNLGVEAGQNWFQFVNIHANLMFGGKFVVARCTKTDGEENYCPICKWVAEGWKNAQTKGEKSMLSNINKKNNFFVPVYVRNGSNEGQVKWWKLSVDNQKKITDFLENKRTAEFTDVEDGTDLIMSKVEKVNDAGKKFTMIDFKMANDDSPLAKSEEEIERIINMQTPLSEIVKTFTPEELKIMLANFVSNIPNEADIAEKPVDSEHHTVIDEDNKLDQLLQDV